MFLEILLISWLFLTGFIDISCNVFVLSSTVMIWIPLFVVVSCIDLFTQPSLLIKSISWDFKICLFFTFPSSISFLFVFFSVHEFSFLVFWWNKVSSRFGDLWFGASYLYFLLLPLMYLFLKKIDNLTGWAIGCLQWAQTTKASSGFAFTSSEQSDCLHRNARMCILFYFLHHRAFHLSLVSRAKSLYLATCTQSAKFHEVFVTSYGCVTGHWEARY